MAISYATIHDTNINFPKDTVKNPVGVFVGGTRGIGESTACEFAKCTIKPTIYLVGHDTERGAAVSTRIRTLNADAKVHFLQHDLIYIEQAQRLANTIRNSEDKINVISVSQGYQSHQPRSVTSEGIDEKLALAYYSRWTIINMLINLVQKAADAGEPARVLTVQGAGNEIDIDLFDLELAKRYTPERSEKMASTYNSLACLRFARLYPSIAFIHSHPGHVRNANPAEQPVWHKLLTIVPSLTARTPERSGEYHIYEAYTGKEFANGAHMLDQNLAPISKSDPQMLDHSIPTIHKNGPSAKNYSEANQDAVWKHTEEMIMHAVESDMAQPSA